VRPNGIPITRGRGAVLDTDTDLIEEALRLMRATGYDRKRAKQFVFLWLLVLAAYDNTVPSDELSALQRTAPTRHDQAAIVQRLRLRRFAEERLDA
jgi:hypothetical protein